MLRVAAVPLLALLLLPLAAPAPVPVPECPEDLVAARLVPEFDVSLAPCPGIRPGAALVLHLGPEWWFPLQAELILCTMGFIVTDGTDLYVTTAGHCVVGADNEIPPGSRAEMAGGLQFGTPVYAWCEGSVTNAPCSLGRDFGLIRIDADKRDLVDPAMCAWGAPTGGVFSAATYARDPLAPALVQHFGWGTGIAAPTVGVTQVNGMPLHVQPANPATQARAGVLAESSGATAFMYDVSAPGDSGSAGMVVVTDPAGASAGDPQALGILTHISAGGTFLQRLDVSLARAGAAMGKTLTLVSE